MKFHSMALLALLATLAPAFGQVEVEVVVDQDKFLPAEELMAGVRIVNRSGQTLLLGEEADWIKFSIEQIGGGTVHQISQPPVQGEFSLQSTERATVKVDLAPRFDLRQQGRYVLTATVKIKEWGQALTTKPVRIEIVEGTKLWTQEFGVPSATGETQLPEMRSYTLQQANYLKSQLRLYLRVAGSDGRVIKMLNLGPMISFGRPEPQLDRQSRLHVLYQNGAKTFSYIVVNPQGEITKRQTFEYADTRPRLSLDDAKNIVVSGGARRISADDLPVPLASKDDSKEIKP